MYGVDLTEEQHRQFLYREEENRARLEKLHREMVEQGFPKDDPYRLAVRDSLLSSRRLCLVWAGGLRKGEHCRYMRRVQCWPAV